MTDCSDNAAPDDTANSIKELKVGLFTTCLVDTFKPEIAEATLEILEDAGCKVHMPLAQNCCALTAWNMSDHDEARDLALCVIKQYAASDYVVVPSKSCAIMLSENYPTLFKKDPTWKEEALSFAGKVHEFSDFLKRVLHQDHAFEETSHEVISDDPAFMLASHTQMKKSGDSRKLTHVAEALRARKKSRQGQD